MKEKSCPRRDVDLCETASDDDGISPADEARSVLRSRMRQKQRGGKNHRDLQYCKQARQALESALSCDLADTDLRALIVIEVRPLKGSALLEVTLGSDRTNSRDLQEQHDRLVAVSGVLRAAVAGATHRKRVASLRFRLLPVQP